MVIFHRNSGLPIENGGSFQFVFWKRLPGRVATAKKETATARLAIDEGIKDPH